MSKLIPGQSIIHLMESNVAGNKQGEQVNGEGYIRGPGKLKGRWHGFVSL